MNTVLHDVRHAGRALMRAPGFAFAAIGTLALGIGTVTVIFSLVNAVLLRSLPYPAADRLVEIAEDDRASGARAQSVSYPTFLDWRERSRTVATMAAYTETNVAVRAAAAAERRPAALVSATLFGVLGVPPVLGRDFQPADEGPAAAPAVIVSHGFWQREMDAAVEVLGSTIAVDGVVRTIVGVMPPGFAFPERAELWLPIALDASAGRGERFLSVVGRLASTASPDDARGEIESIERTLEAEFPFHFENRSASVRTLAEATTGELRPILLVQLGAVGFLLLIACANVANLLLARANQREREIAVRSALGASRSRILRQLLTETGLIGLLGGGVGVLLALWGLRGVHALLPVTLPFWLRLNVDLRVLAFVLVISLLTAFLCGLAPALHLARKGLGAVLRVAARDNTCMARSRVRNALVVAQISLALTLLVGGLLLARSFVALRGADLGFDATHVSVLRVTLPQARYEAATTRAFFEALLERTRATPGVETAALVSSVPLGNSHNVSNFSVDGLDVTEIGAPADAFNVVVTPDYFATLRIPLLRGRDFATHDDADGEPVAIVNQELARRLFGVDDAVGRRIAFGAGNVNFMRIVGVVADARQRSAAGREPPFAIYRPHAQQPRRDMALVQRAFDHAAAIDAGRTAVHALDPDAPAYDASTLRQVVARATLDIRLASALFVCFAALALILAAVGLYGVVAFNAEQRRHEIGVRLALGAHRRDVVRLVVRQGMKLTAIGTSIGLGFAFATSRLLRSVLYGVSPNDAITFSAVPLLLAACALLASWLPARRAARADPLRALRGD